MARIKQVTIRVEMTDGHVDEQVIDCAGKDVSVRAEGASIHIPEGKCGLAPPREPGLMVGEQRHTITVLHRNRGNPEQATAEEIIERGRRWAATGSYE